MISTNGGTGNVTDANINAQMAVLNEDFAAITTPLSSLSWWLLHVNDEWFADSSADEVDYKSR